MKNLIAPLLASLIAVSGSAAWAQTTTNRVRQSTTAVRWQPAPAVTPCRRATPAVTPADVRRPAPESRRHGPRRTTRSRSSHRAARPPTSTTSPFRLPDRPGARRRLSTARRSGRSLRHRRPRHAQECLETERRFLGAVVQHVGSGSRATRRAARGGLVPDERTTRGVHDRDERRADRHLQGAQRRWAPPSYITPPNFAEPGAQLAAVFQPLNNQLEVFAIDRDGHGASRVESAERPLAGARRAVAGRHRASGRAARRGLATAQRTARSVLRRHPRRAASRW